MSTTTRTAAFAALATGLATTACTSGGAAVTTTWFAAEPARRALRRLATDRDLTVCAIAENLGVDRCTIQRLFTRDRVRWDAADHIAVALGYHPCQLWTEWFNDIEETA